VKWQAASLILTKYTITLSVPLATSTVSRQEGCVYYVYEHLLIKMITGNGDSRNGNGFSIAAMGFDFFHDDEEEWVVL
jgi:hypothetical protein